MNLKYELAQFIGTQQYHRLSVFKQLASTDGVAFLAKKAECFWLIDQIASHLQQLAMHDDNNLFVVNLKVDKETDKGIFRIHDGNRGGGEIEYINEMVHYTDFPLDEITMYLQKADKYWVLMLTSEY